MQFEIKVRVKLPYTELLIRCEGKVTQLLLNQVEKEIVIGELRKALGELGRAPVTDWRR